MGEGGDLGPGARSARRYPVGRRAPRRRRFTPTSTSSADGPAPAGAYPEGASPYGCSGHDRRRLGVDGEPLRRLSRLRSPTPTRSIREVFFGSDYRVLRGGSWATRSPRDHTHLPQLGLPPAPPDLRRLPDREGPTEQMKLRTEHRTTIRIDSWLSEAEERRLANDVLDGLTRPFKEIPPKHFYDARGLGAVRADLRAARVLPDAHRARDPRAPRGRDRRRRPAPASSSSSAPARPRRRGSCSTRWPRAGTLRRYVPLDVSESVVEDAAERARRGVRRAAGPWRDRRLRAPPRAACPPADGVPRIVALLGGTIGNFPPGTRRRPAARDRARCSAPTTGCCSAPTSSRTRR